MTTMGATHKFEVYLLYWAQTSLNLICCVCDKVRNSKLHTKLQSVANSLLKLKF